MWEKENPADPSNWPAACYLLAGSNGTNMTLAVFISWSVHLDSFIVTQAAHVE